MAYIAQDSERYATRMVDRITNRTKQFALFPYSGRVAPEFEDETIREIIEGPYRVIYQIRPKSILVSAVVHSSTSTGWR